MTARCRKCKRPLRNPSPDGLGRVCRARLNAAKALMETALTGLSPASKTKALALISSGNVRPTGRPGRYSVPGSGKGVRYSTATDGCTCRAAAFGNLCAHVGSVRAIEAVRASLTRRAA
jgi:hypothetical protein